LTLISLKQDRCFGVFFWMWVTCQLEPLLVSTFQGKRSAGDWGQVKQESWGGA